MKACTCFEKLQYLCIRLKGAVCRHCCRVGRSKRGSLKMSISEPYDFKKLSGTLDGASEDEVNVLREKAAASRLVPIEDHHPAAFPPPSTATTTANFGIAASRGGSVSSQSSGGGRSTIKTRAGYRGLASSASAGGVVRGGGLTYATTLTESRPSITRSFAAMDEAGAGGLSPAMSSSVDSAP